MKKLILTACAVLFSISLMQSQEFKIEKNDNKKKEKLQVKAKEGAEPDIYVDGKKFDFSMDLIDNDMIASVAVLKGDRAIKEYNAPNGVILVTTNKKHELDKSSKKTNFKGKTPVIIIDGKVANKETLDKLSTDDIEKIEVFKDEKAMKKYNTPNGAIIITTKKEKKE
jgi:ribosomal protein S8